MDDIEDFPSLPGVKKVLKYSSRGRRGKVKPKIVTWGTYNFFMTYRYYLKVIKCC